MDSSSEWVRYFRGNVYVTLVAIPWEAGCRLSPVERRAVGPSLAGFQAGESSDGRRLLRFAQRYAERTGDADYVEALRLFVAEEQRHARLLGRFLTLNGVPLERTNPLDRVFRRLRHLLGTLEVAVAVLVTAEIIAEVYYAAILHGSGSKVLRAICSQILRDEERHVEFQAEQLGRMRARRGPVAYAATMVLQRLLFGATCAAVWAVHGRALRACGETAASFHRSAGRRFTRAFDLSAAARDPCRGDRSIFPGSPIALTRPRVRQK